MEGIAGQQFGGHLVLHCFSKQLRGSGLGAKPKCGFVLKAGGEEKGGSCFLSTVFFLSQPVTVPFIFPLKSLSFMHRDTCRVNTDPLGPTLALSMSLLGLPRVMVGSRSKGQ